MDRKRDLVWRQKCGAWSLARAAPMLKVECQGRPSSAFHKYTFSRLRRGLAPFPVGHTGSFIIKIVLGFF
eukprot:15255040-Heterocapsa_arctica.AAC.1